MEPIVLFDKSFLQSLSEDESVWFDHFFTANVCPLFHVETLADLAKPAQLRRAPEDEVRIIARKFPVSNGIPSIFHTTLCENELLGESVPLTGQIPVAGGKAVRSGYESGMVFDEFPESLAFARWQKRQFDALERQTAHHWRKYLSDLDLSRIAEMFRKLGIDGKLCKTLEDAKRMAEEIVMSEERPLDRVQLALFFLGIDRRLHHEIIDRWATLSYRPIAKYAPYCAHVLRVELFFQFALAANLISSDRPSNRADIAYLFYLPFCHLFVSSDRLHRKCAQLFLKPNQQFVWGLDLKEGLKILNDYYSAVPVKVREQGLNSFARWPPTDRKYLVSEIYDWLLPGWRSRVGNAEAQKNPAKDAEVLSRMKSLKSAAPLRNDQVDFDVQSPDALLLERLIPKKKGSWYLLPKDLKE